MLQYKRVCFFILTLLFSCLFSLYAATDLDSQTQVLQYLNKKGLYVSTNNRVVVFHTGREKFNHLFMKLREAQHHIHLEYFNFRNDSIARELFTILAHKAAEGVEIRVIFDGFGNCSNNKPLKKKHLRMLRKSGIKIIEFDPVNFPYVNHGFHRDHRKIVVIDGKIGYTGGMNVADYYIDGIPEIGPWYDKHVCLEGDAAQELQHIFIDFWNKLSKQPIYGKRYFPDFCKTDSTGSSRVVIATRIPKKAPGEIRHIYIEAIRSAQHKIQIVSAYFTPTRTFIKELKRAAQRGVKVEILFSDDSDIPFVPSGEKYVARRLALKGVKVYLFKGGFHHSKIMMIDTTYCTIGSANMNSRSIRYDYEVNAFIFDKKVTKELCDYFDYHKMNSTVLDDAYWEKRTIFHKFIGFIAFLCTPFL